MGSSGINGLPPAPPITPFPPTGNPTPPIPTHTPTPAPAKKGKGGLSGGDIVLLIAFLSVFVYVVGGMLINYKNNRGPQIPHAKFWSQVPGLISDGVFFTFCQCCGMRASRAHYSSLNDENANYGSL